MINPNLTLLKYRVEIILAVVLGMFSSLSWPTAAGAAEERLELDKFEVTGSHIKRTDFEGMSSVVVMDQAFIEKSGFTSLNQLFRDVIYNSTGVVDEQFTQGFTPGSASIDLRGVGVNRTLVLVNGRRTPLFPFGQEGGASFVDINLIPLGAVERVEILKDGASAIYGSDAIAGVVNIILRDDYDGVEASLQYGQASEGDGEEGWLNLTGGHTGEKGNVTFILDYLQRDTVWAKDRAITASANGPIDDRSSFGNPGTIIRADGSREPDVQADPDDAQIPYSSIISKMASPSTYSNAMLEVLRRRLSGSPFLMEFGMRSSNAFSSLSRKARIRSFSAPIWAAASSAALPSPMMEATFSVPPLRPCSWCPPIKKGANLVPRRT